MIVEDVTNPIVITQNQAIDLYGETSISILPEDIDNGSSDNCDDFTLSLNIDTFTSIGFFTVELTATDSVGNNTTETAEVTVVDTIGIDDVILNSLAVYPNPSDNIFNISWNGGEAIHIQVTDILGKLILETTEIESVNKPYALDLSNYKSGVYFMQVSVNGRETVKKLVLK